MSSKRKSKNLTSRFPCHCCHKRGTIYWSDKRQSFVCDNCLKSFDRAVIAKRNGMAADQLSLC